MHLNENPLSLYTENDTLQFARHRNAYTISSALGTVLGHSDVTRVLVTSQGY